MQDSEAYYSEDFILPSCDFYQDFTLDTSWVSQKQAMNYGEDRLR